MQHPSKSLVRRAAILALIFSVSGRVAYAEPAGDNAQFIRGLNLNGPPLTIDGHDWEGKDSKTYKCNGDAFENQAVVLKPSTDEPRARMIRSSRWGRSIDVELLELPAATYQIFLYVWEDNDSSRFEVLVNDKSVIRQFDSGAGGTWRKLGPWLASPRDGAIKLSARGGDANLSGIEIWSGTGSVPKPPGPEFVSVPTAEQVEFFERKIRPVLADHCYQCHSAGAEKLGGSLLLDSRSGVIKGGDSEPPVIPGDPDASLLMTAVRHTDASLKMPPKKKLSDTQIEDLAAWIRMGAPDPRTADTTAQVKSKYAIDWDKAREFWSLRPARLPDLPAVRDAAWPRSDLDRFILARLDANGLAPVADADRRTLIRRATYDLVGLPPTPQEIDSFEDDSDPNAFARVIDRLLASPQYGERWGRHWLDVVRYADTAGDNSDFPIPQMHLYRNWVIDAFNRDLPYDRFVREQLAGDLLPAADETSRKKQTIATGYIANARRFGSRVDDYPQHLTIEDTIDNVGRAFLGTTVNCARCHDHKFDPISTQDYYALYGIFHSTRYPWPGIELEQKQRDLVPLVPAAEVESTLAARKSEQERLDADVRRLEKERDAAQGEDRQRLDKASQAARKTAETFSKTPLAFEQAYAVAEAAHVEDVRVQQKGDPNKTGPLVHRHFLTVLGGAELPVDDRTSGRVRLADWIVSPENPLAARVMVNRIWQYHFGKGLVPTPNDFGRQGKPPTHPELLDWLANRFVESGWSIKSMHRLIMLSHAYRLSGSPPAEAHVRDPNNECLSYFPRRRLDAEAIRDTLLALGGNLDPTPGGPHPFPPQTNWNFSQHNPFKAVYETNRRSVYLMTQRIQRHPYLSIFDGADPSVSTGARPTSTTPLQALYLLNDPLVHEQSQRFAARVVDLGTDDSQRLEQAYRLALGRRPASDEVADTLKFLDAVRAELQAGGVSADRLDREAWQAAIRAIFRLNEFVYVD